jgi:hypothetical protein
MRRGETERKHWTALSFCPLSCCLWQFSCIWQFSCMEFSNNLPHMSFSNDRFYLLELKGFICSCCCAHFSDRQTDEIDWEMSHTMFPRGTTLMNEDDDDEEEEEEEEVLEVSSSPSSASEDSRAAACCMVSASRIKLSMAPANLSEAAATAAASSSPIAAAFFFFCYYRCSWTENWVPSSSSSSYKEEKQRPLDPFSPRQPKATAAAGFQFLRNLENCSHKILSRYSRTDRGDSLEAKARPCLCALFHAPLSTAQRPYFVGTSLPANDRRHTSGERC